MTERLRRLIAIVRADILIRFRRPSTVVVFLLLSGAVYLLIPDPSTGRAVLVLDEGRRALYDSAAIGLATAVLATLFVGMVGFYVVSNAIGRDVSSRCGSVIASTTTRSSDYLIGKLAGNVAFLGTFIAGFMLSSMVMLVLRNEAALDPWAFVRQYALLVPPAIVFVAVLAIVFESIPFLAGRLGDVVYFFVWLASFAVVVSVVANGSNPGVARYFDFAGMGFVFEQLRATMHTKSLSIGGSTFDATKPLFVVKGLTLDRSWALPRLTALLTPLSLLAVGIGSFHRFDPARVRMGGARGHRSWIKRINTWLKPLTRVPFLFGGRMSTRPSLVRAAAIDARMALAANPAMLLVGVGAAIATVANSWSGFAGGVLPFALGAVGITIAGVACRDRQAGTLELICSAPLLKVRYVWWKALASGLVVVGLLAMPIGRVAFTSPLLLPALGVGILFVVALATALGVISSTPKTFIVVFLTFMYVVINDSGKSPALDFGGFYGNATPGVTLTYAGIALALLGAGEILYAWRLRRES